MEYKRLLLIFKPTPDGDYILVNSPGLPISPYCTALTRTPVIDLPASLLNTLTDVLEGSGDDGVFGGFTFLLTRPANDGRHAIVILEKAVPADPDNPVQAASISNDDDDNNNNKNEDARAADFYAAANWNSNANAKSNADDTHRKENIIRPVSPNADTPFVPGQWDDGFEYEEQTWPSTSTRRTQAVKHSDTSRTRSRDTGRKNSAGERPWSPKEAQKKRGWEPSPVRSTLRHRSATVGDWESEVRNVRDWAWTPSSTESADDDAV